MDSNRVNNYLGHVLRAKCWHSLHVQACQKRQTGETWKSHCAQLIWRLHKDSVPQVSGMKKRGLEGSCSAWKCVQVVAATLAGLILHFAGINLVAKENPPRKGTGGRRCGSHNLRCPAGRGKGGKVSTDSCCLSSVAGIDFRCLVET